MKRLATVVAVVAGLAMSSIALAAIAPSGTYKTTIKSGTFKGSWRITFKKSGYTVAYNGKVVIHGTDTIKGTAMTVRDTSGAFKCNGTGHYTFKLTATKLTFKKVSDTRSCTGRVAVLTSGFTKV